MIKKAGRFLANRSAFIVGNKLKCAHDDYGCPFFVVLTKKGRKPPISRKFEAERDRTLVQSRPLAIERGQGGTVASEAKRRRKAAHLPSGSKLSHSGEMQDYPPVANYAESELVIF